MEELPDEVRLIARPIEDPVDPEILGADVRTEIFPFGIVGIGRRLQRIRADVAKAARHPYSEGPHQVFVVVIIRVVVILLGVPMGCRLLVEVGVGEKPQANNARLIAVVGANFQFFAVRSDGLASGTERDSGYFFSSSKGSGAQSGRR